MADWSLAEHLQRLTVLAVVAMVCACQRHPPALSSQAYVWQRNWTPALVAAITEHRARLDGLRVLASERGSRGQFTRMAPDLTALARSGQPLVAVLRWDGRLQLDEQGALQREVLAIIAQWRAAGIVLTGIEIDHDCASSRLADYRRALLDLRAQLPVGVGLSITALPAWLGQDELPSLLRTVDEAVLQVHSVDAHATQLFDSDQALRWLSAFAAQDRGQFRLALPAYGSRIWRAADGAIHALASEQSDQSAETTGEELRADPRAVAGLLHRLDRERPSNLRGIVWFRLPTADDRRAWSPKTFAAVLDRQTLQATLSLSVQPAADGADELLLANEGTLDAALPRQLSIIGRCAAADASSGYRAERAADGWHWVLQTGAVLRAAYRRKLGWIRCDVPPQVRIDVDSE